MDQVSYSLGSLIFGIPLSASCEKLGDSVKVDKKRKVGEGEIESLQKDALDTQETREIHLFHVNDIHGNIEPEINKSISSESAVGGLSYIGSMINKLRKDHPDNLLLNAGDVAQGSFESELYQGRPVFDVINYLKFDAVELGNHDFALGRDILTRMLASLASPILGANILNRETSKPIDGVKSSIVRKISGITIGIIGVNTPKVPEYVRPEELKGIIFPKPVEIVKSQLAKLKDEGADIIIVLSHLGRKEDRELAMIPGIDVIVGGHDHDALQEGEKVGNTIIVQAGCNNQYVGDLCLSIDPHKKKIVAYKSRLIPVLKEHISPDPAIEEIIRPYIEESRKKGNEIVGSASDEMRYSYKEITPLGQHLADAMREAAGTPLAIVSGKMLRAGLKAGQITRRELFNSYPNNEYLVSLKIKGKYIKEELEKRYADDSRAVMIPSGFSFTVDKKLPNGQRITSITIDGKPMEMEREYEIAVSDNQARYETFKTARDQENIGLLRDVWFNYIKSHSPLSNELDGRVRFE